MEEDKRLHCTCRSPSEILTLFRLNGSVFFLLIFVIVFPDGFNGDSNDHHTLLLFLMMTASDLSDQTKNWEGTRRTAVSKTAK